MKRISKAYWLSVLAPVAAVLAFMTLASGVREDVQNLVFDNYQRVSPRA